MATKEFGAKVPESLLNEFRFLFPQYGATTWFINAALENFVDTVRDDPVAQKRIQQAIESLLEQRRGQNESENAG